jgi:hypothetical protein
MTFILKLLVVLLTIGYISADEISISYNGLTNYFEPSDCTVDIIADSFELDPDSNIHLKCGCGSSLYPNEYGLFEGVSSDNIYECISDEEDIDCSCNSIITIELEMLNNWYEESDYNVRAVKTGNIVYLLGAANNPGLPLTTMFILPEGFRPLQNIFFVETKRSGSINIDGTATLSITTQGVVSITQRNGNSPKQIPLDKISFVAA